MTVRAMAKTSPSYLFNVITPLQDNLMLYAFHKYKHYKPFKQHTSESYFYVLNNVIYLKII